MRHKFITDAFLLKYFFCFTCNYFDGRTRFWLNKLKWRGCRWCCGIFERHWWRVRTICAAWCCSLQYDSSSFFGGDGRQISIVFFFWLNNWLCIWAFMRSAWYLMIFITYSNPFSCLGKKKQVNWLSPYIQIGFYMKCLTRRYCLFVSVRPMLSYIFWIRILFYCTHYQVYISSH